MYKVIFEKSNGRKIEIASSIETTSECFSIIQNFRKRHGHETFYFRSRVIEPGVTWIDAGSHTEFFYIVEENT